MNDAAGNLLSQLRDIHGAHHPGWWPPAWGWWVTGLLTAAGFALAAFYLYRWWSSMRRRRKMMVGLRRIAVEIDPEQQPHEYLSGLNRLFRVVALRAFPGTGCARLQGEDWVNFIRSRLPRATSAGGLAALASGPYEPRPEFDAGELQKLARAWVRKYG